jgi:hypothetical protein
MSKSLVLVLGPNYASQMEPFGSERSWSPPNDDGGTWDSGWFLSFDRLPIVYDTVLPLGPLSWSGAPGRARTLSETQRAGWRPDHCLKREVDLEELVASLLATDGRQSVLPLGALLQNNVWYHSWPEHSNRIVSFADGWEFRRMVRDIINQAPLDIEMTLLRFHA